MKRSTLSTLIFLVAFAWTTAANAQATATVASRACPPDLAGSCSVVNTWFNLVVALTNNASPESLQLTVDVCSRLDRETAGLERAFRDHARTQTGSADRATGGTFTTVEAMRAPGVVETSRRFCTDLRALVTNGTVPAALSNEGEVDITSYTGAVVETTSGRISAGEAMQHAVDGIRRRGQRPARATSAHSPSSSTRSPGMCRLPPPSGTPAPQPPPG